MNIRRLTRPDWIVGIFLVVLFLSPLLYPLNSLFRGVFSKKNQGLLGTYLSGAIEESPQPVYVPLVFPLARIMNTQIDESLEFNWLTRNTPVSSPFSVEWKGFIDIEEGGAYTFWLLSDDGSCLYIDNRLVIDNWGYHGSQARAQSIALSSGLHPIAVRYVNYTGWADMKLLWDPLERGQLYSIPKKTLRLKA